MISLLERIRALVGSGEVRLSDHGYDELAADGLTAREVIEGIRGAVIVEAYPDYPKGPSILVMQKDGAGAPVHVVWGIPKGHDTPAVLVTAYRPDPERWDETLTMRR
jgi:hypothetical protein